MYHRLELLFVLCQQYYRTQSKELNHTNRKILNQVLHYILFRNLCYQTRSIYLGIILYQHYSHAFGAPHSFFSEDKFPFTQDSVLGRFYLTRCLFLVLEPGQHSRCSIHRLDVSRNRGSTPGSVKRFFSSPKRPDRLWGPPTTLFNGHRELFPRG
jgi:hypothetical protein